MVYSALLYEGVGQKMVKIEARNEAEFFTRLDQQYGCYVCLWFAIEQDVLNEPDPLQSTH